MTSMTGPTTGLTSPSTIEHSSVGEANAALLTRFEREHMDGNSITPDRRVEQLRVLGLLCNYLEGRLLTEMVPADVLGFMGTQIREGSRDGGGLAPNTVRKYHGMIRAFNTWAFSVGLIEGLAYAHLKAVPNPRGSSAQSEPKPYSAAEVKRFYALLAAKYPTLPTERGKGSLLLRRYYDGRGSFNRIWRHARRLQYEAMVSLALEEGLRRIEIHQATLQSIHYDNQGVVVITAKQGPGKQHEREIPFTSHSRACVQDWLDFRQTLALDHDHPWLSLSPWHEMFAPMGMEQLASLLQKTVGPEWHWHGFRHTFATERLRAKMPLEKLQIMMGHGTLEQTLAYAKIVQSDVQEDAERTEPAFAERLGLVA